VHNLHTALIHTEKLSAGHSHFISKLPLSVPTVQPTRCTCYLKLFILVKRSTCFGRSFSPSSGAQNCARNNGICQTAAAVGDEMELTMHGPMNIKFVFMLFSIPRPPE
jgi:hypothetical protein